MFVYPALDGLAAAEAIERRVFDDLSLHIEFAPAIKSN